MKKTSTFFRLSGAAVSCKRLWMVMLVLFAASFAWADPITREQAQKKAETLVKNMAGSRKLAPVTNSRRLAPGRAVSAENALYYVFNRENNGGYVIIAGDDAIDPPLGYTDSGEFDYQAIPDNMRYWLDSYATYIEQLQSTPNAKPRKVPTHPAISPMLTSKWNQGAPYNNECPMYFSLGRSVTGCVATAMAQVMYHQKAKGVDEVQADIPGYTTWTSHETYGQLAVEGIPAGSPIDWANMLDTYSGGSTGKQQLAVAQLMHYCGVSVEMDYTNSSSGAQSYKVADALNNYFGYSKARYVERRNYTDDSWDALIYSELEQGRVCYLSGANSAAGHAFVTDGYDGNHCYHINWGWGGMSDGFFLLSSLNPSSQGIGGSGDGYSQYQDAVIGCEPDNYSEKEMPIANATVKRLCIENWDTNGDGKFTFGEAAAVTDLGEVFKGQRISAFTELYNFTGLTHIADNAFDGCTTLTSVKLPKKLKSIGDFAFNGCRALKVFKIPEHVVSIGKSAFAGCRALPEVTLPSGLTEISESSFSGCILITDIDLPINVTKIGANAFSGCTRLASFTVHSVSPSSIEMGVDVFASSSVAKATLYAEQGTADYYRSADQWRDFGTIYEERSLSGGNFIELTANKQVYLFNEGTGRYLTKGEAWGTQAVVGSSELMRFELRKNSTMSDSVYYLYSPDTDASGHILFRTSNDNNVGVGVKACFVDGDNTHISDKTSWWRVNSVGDGVYTFQVPSGVAGYAADAYFGVQTDHNSNYASPTYGAYSDISYTNYPRNCQWRFVEYDADQLAKYNEAQNLKSLIEKATKKGTDVSFEQEVYDNLNSSLDEIKAAEKTLRKKLNFINFRDDLLRNVAITYWDSDGDGEITYSEASKITDFGYYTFEGTAFKDLSDLEYFMNAGFIYGNSFQNCRTLEKVNLPANLTAMYYNAFRNCENLREIVLPEYLTTIGTNAFNGCTALTDVTVLVDNPDKIDLGDGAFTGVDLDNATLYVPVGSRELYANAEVWKEFGKIVEVRGRTIPKFSPIEPSVSGYVYNVDMGRYVTNGEAYGTQAVVAKDGLLYQFRRTSSMADGVYYLYSDLAGGSHVLFRTSSDTKVGEGVKTCFVDGQQGATAYWQTELVGDNIYTMQVPATDKTNYVEGEYLGVQTNHPTSYTWETYGLYWDVTADAGHIRWAFITKDDFDAAEQMDAQTKALKKLLEQADAKGIDAASEHAVYDNFNSTIDDINGAIASLRSKMHYIDFNDSRAKALCVHNWDADDDGELSLEEAAAVTDIRTTFRLATTLKSFEELKYFTSITRLDDNAFYKNSSLTSLYIPQEVRTLGTNVFASCSSLKYIAVLANEMVIADNAAVPSKCTVFVPEALVEQYQADPVWGKCTIKPYTGQPVITVADESRQYGRANPTFTFEVDGAPINGTPTFSVPAVADPETGDSYTDLTLPVGEYTIEANTSDISSEGLEVVSGKLTVEPAPLTITARSVTRMQGEENPEFKLNYRGWRNSEKPETALSVLPVVECDATPDSPAGEYEIRVSGAEARNYEITYVNGTLTVEAATAIESISADDLINFNGDIFDLQGRKVSRVSRGIYIVGGKKVIVK